MTTQFLDPVQAKSGNYRQGYIMLTINTTNDLHFVQLFGF